MEYELLNRAASISNNDGSIELIAPGKTDFFIDISSDYKQLNAPFYHTSVENDFIFRCSVQPVFKNTYDAGCLLVYDTEVKWIKFAFENTDLGHPSVVSVVTDCFSDDCNGERIEGKNVFLQIVRKGNDWCLHYSDDKTGWKMVRYFRFEITNKIKIGVSCQSPLGEGCKVIFSDIEILKNDYKNIRKAV
jgi:regulation of enolase protein 1 (concanavalin A-like superfamily)